VSLPDPPPPVYDPCVDQVWDDTTRTVTCTDTEGAVTSTRDYDDSENENADALAATAAAETTERTILDALEAALADLQAIIDDTNSNINSNPAARIKTIARTCRRLVRIATRDLSGTD
jgi:hypothetical protein